MVVTKRGCTPERLAQLATARAYSGSDSYEGARPAGTRPAEGNRKTADPARLQKLAEPLSHRRWKMDYGALSAEEDSPDTEVTSSLSSKAAKRGADPARLHQLAQPKFSEAYESSRQASSVWRTW